MSATGSRVMRPGWTSVPRGECSSERDIRHFVDMVVTRPPGSELLIWAVRDSGGAIMRDGVARDEAAAQLAAEAALRQLLLGIVGELEG